MGRLSNAHTASVIFESSNQWCEQRLLRVRSTLHVESYLIKFLIEINFGKHALAIVQETLQATRWNAECT